jgi:cardiolipin synthase
VSVQTIERLLRWARRTFLVVFGVPVLIGIAMSLVDSYRRRGK